MLNFREASGAPTSRDNHSQASKVHSLVLTCSENYIFDENFFSHTNFVQMLSEYYEPIDYVSLVYKKVVPTSVASIFLTPLDDLSDSRKQPVLEIPDLGPDWIGMTTHKRHEPIRCEFFYANEPALTSSEYRSFAVGLSKKSKNIQRNTENQPVVDLTYHFYEGQDYTVWREYKAVRDIMEVYSITWKLRQGFVFYITHIVLDPSYRPYGGGTSLFKEFKQIHVQLIRVTEPDFMRYTLYKAVPHFFAGYLLVFQSLSKTQFYFAYQPTDVAELSRTEGTTMLASLQTAFEIAFSDIIAQGPAELNFEIFPLISKTDRVKSQQRILMVSFGKFRRLFEIDKYRGFEVISIGNFQSYLDLSRYNPWFYLYLRDLRNAESLLDIFQQHKPSRLTISSTESHFFYVNPRKSLLLLIRFPKINYRHLTIKILSFHPFISTFGKERKFRLLLCPLSLNKFLDYVELLTFHVFLFQRENTILVYRALRSGPIVDLPKEVEVSCELESIVPSHFLNQIFLICKSKVVVIFFSKKAFQVSFGKVIDSKNVDSGRVNANFNTAYSYPKNPRDLAIKGAVVENLVIKFLQNINPKTGVLSRFLETQRIKFLDTYTLCKDYLFTGAFLAFDLRILGQSGEVLETQTYAPLEKAIAFQFETITKMHAFSFIDSSARSRDSILNSKVYLLLQTKDSILYLYEGISKFINSKGAERFLGLSNIRRLLQCDLFRQLHVLGTILIGCRNPPTISYYLFDREKRNFVPMPELEDCETLNFIQAEKIFMCVRVSGVLIYSIARGKIQELGAWKYALDNSLSFYSTQLRSDFVVRYRPITGKQPTFGIEVTQISVSADDRLTFHHLLSEELPVDWEISCCMFTEKNLIVLLCKRSYYVWYLDIDRNRVIPTKKGQLKLGDTLIERKEELGAQIITYTNHFFENPLSGSQAMEVVIVFLGCVGARCGIIHFNAGSPDLSTLSEFIPFKDDKKVDWSRQMFSGLDVIAGDLKADSEPTFRGYLLTTLTSDEPEGGIFYTYKARIFYPFKSHFILDLHNYTKNDFLTIETTPFRLPDLAPQDKTPVKITLERSKERQLDVYLSPSSKWVAKVPDIQPGYHTFQLHWSEFISSHVLQVEVHATYLADNFVDVVKLSPRFVQRQFLTFETEVTKKIQLCDTRPILNLLDEHQTFYVQTDNEIFEFRDKKLENVFAVNKYLNLPVSFLTKINEIDCHFKMVPKTAVVLSLCRPKNSQQPYRLFNMASLDGSLERSPDFLNFLERIRSSEYQKIVIKKNYILLTKTEVQESNELSDVMYPFIILRSKERFFWFADPVSVSHSAFYSKIHWVKFDGVWYHVHFSIDDIIHENEASFNIHVGLGESVVKASHNRLRSVGLIDLLRQAPRSRMISQMGKGCIFFAFPVRSKFLVVIKLIFPIRNIFPNRYATMKAELRDMSLVALGKNKFEVAFWKIQMEPRTVSAKLIFLPSRRGSMAFLLRAGNFEHLNVIWLGTGQPGSQEKPVVSFQPVNITSPWSSYMGPLMITYIEDNAMYPFLTRMYPRNTILSVRMLAKKKCRTCSNGRTAPGSFVYLILLKDRIETLRVFKRQNLSLKKSFFRSKELVFTITSPMHVVRYIVNVKRFRDYFDIPQTNRVYDGYYLILFSLVFLLGGFGLPLVDWYRERHHRATRLKI